MKRVVITGSSRGMGFAMALEFLNAGCLVTLSDIGEFLPEDTLSLLKPFEDKYIYVSCDVQHKENIQKLWDTSHSKWNGIDIWINNAGKNTPYLNVWDTASNYTENILKTNIIGMIYGSQVAANEMLKQGYGAIYSMEGLGSNNMIQKKTILYGTTKHALTYFMKGLAKELSKTNVIAGRLYPGMMLTDFITKTPDGDSSEVIEDKTFKKIFNILADKPETVAKFFIPKILSNKKNNSRIVWLTNTKTAWRFMTAWLRKDRLI